MVHTASSAAASTRSSKLNTSWRPFWVMSVMPAAMAAGITDITQKGRQLVFSFDDRVDAAALLAVCTMAAYRSRAQLSAGAQPRLTLHMQPKEEPLAAAGGLVEALCLHEKDIPQTDGAPAPKEETK